MTKNNEGSSSKKMNPHKKNITTKIKNLSQIQKRVEYLKVIQAEHDALVKERAAYEAQYKKSIESLYKKRYDIVNGVADVEGVTTETTAEAEEKGVPSFWLNAMKNDDILAEEITKRDKHALKYLKDINWTKLGDKEGFVLKFSFDSNPYFSNSHLTKTFRMVDGKPKKAMGTEIKWFPKKRLTRVRGEPKKSFFNFFKIIYQKIFEDMNFDEIDPYLKEELQDEIEHDYYIGETIRDEIIPQAVSLFTNEAAQEEDSSEDMDSDNEDEDEEKV
ncbi:nucleosome assembly protein 1-2 [Trifolium repens]|nr:nucleosome assembly protein 1-2 [Trifolium repens]